MLKQAKFVSVNKETETSTITNNEATEEPNEIYEELDSESEILEEENCIQEQELSLQVEKNEAALLINKSKCFNG